MFLSCTLIAYDRLDLGPPLLFDHTTTTPKFNKPTLHIRFKPILYQLPIAQLIETCFFLSFIHFNIALISAQAMAYDATSARLVDVAHPAQVESMVVSHLIHERIDNHRYILPLL